MKMSLLRQLTSSNKRKRRRRSSKVSSHCLDFPSTSAQPPWGRTEAKQTEEEKQAPDFVGDLAAGVGGVAMAAAAATVAGVSGAATQATEAIQHVLHPDQGEENKEDVSDATKANLTSAPINHIETHSVATVPGEAPADPAPSRSPEAQPEQNHSVSTVPSDEKIAAATGALSEKPISNSSIALNPPPMPTSEEIGRLMPNPSLVTERPASPGLGSRAKEAVLGAGVGVTAGAAGVAAAVKSEGSKAKETVKEKVESTPEKVTSVDGRPNSFGAPPIAASPVKKAEAETKTVDPALEPQTQQAQATSGTVTDAKPIAPSAASTEPPTTPKKSTTESKQETPITPANKKETPTNKVQQEQGTATSAKSTPGDFATAPTTPQGTPSKVVTKRKSGFFNKIKVRVFGLCGCDYC